MRKIIMILVFSFLTIVGFGQKDSSLLGSGFSSLTFRTIPILENYLEIRSDSSIEIHGDTIQIIKELMKYIAQRDSIINAKNKLVWAFIYFLNEIPGYWKSKEQNCKYGDWYGEITKNGYIITEGKQRQHKPCN